MLEVCDKLNDNTVIILYTQNLKNYHQITMPLGKYFFITSEMNDLVLDIRGGSHDSGTQIITWPKKDGECANQLWYADHSTGTIRSKMHDLCLDISGKCYYERRNTLHDNVLTGALFLKLNLL